MPSEVAGGNRRGTVLIRSVASRMPGLAPVVEGHTMQFPGRKRRLLVSTPVRDCVRWKRSKQTRLEARAAV